MYYSQICHADNVCYDKNRHDLFDRSVISEENVSCSYTYEYLTLMECTKNFIFQCGPFQYYEKA